MWFAAHSVLVNISAFNVEGLDYFHFGGWSACT